MSLTAQNVAKPGGRVKVIIALIKDDKVTVAAALLFADEPQAILPKQSGIKVYRFKTTAPEGSRDSEAFIPRTVEGCLYKQIYAAVKLRELATEYQMYLERNPPQAPKAIEFTAEEKAESERRVRAASQMPMPQKWEPTPVTVDSLKPPPMEWGPAISVECERKQYHQPPLPEQMHPLPPDNTPIK